MDIIIETPKGSSEKYKYDLNTKMFRLKKILPAGYVFPFAFGYIPFTKGEDGDPLDALIISELTGYPGCVVECRIIGCIKAKQKDGKEKVRNDRFLAVAKESREFEDVKTVRDLPDRIVDEIEDFFVHYADGESKKVKVLDIVEADEAVSMIPETYEVSIG
jgi:inorganic pyrophosphatase